MSDEKLRELERRWKETGAAHDEAALLLERVRVGDLEQSKLELAAQLGHEAAGRGIGRELRPIEPEAADESSLLSMRDPCWGLSRWGKLCLARLLSAIAHGLLAYFELEADAPALIHAEAVLVSEDCGPSTATREALLGYLDEASDDHSRWYSFVQRDAHVLGIEILTVLLKAYGVQREWNQGEYPPDNQNATEYLEGALSTVSSETLLPLFRFGAEEAEGRSPRAARAAVLSRVREELVPWALGYRDPVRERVEARKREGTGE